MRDDAGLVSGTLDLLVLRSLAWGPQHGFGVARWIQSSSADAILVEDRSLYLALHRLEERHFVESEWGLSENKRRARFYQLTMSGRQELQARSTRWARYAEAVARILQSSTPPVASHA
ncbi:MAG: PadR family transcriptional regulator [Gemmatimonadota bacterium]